MLDFTLQITNYHLTSGVAMDNFWVALFGCFHNLYMPDVPASLFPQPIALAIE